MPFFTAADGVLTALVIATIVLVAFAVSLLHSPQSGAKGVTVHNERIYKNCTVHNVGSVTTQNTCKESEVTAACTSGAENEAEREAKKPVQESCGYEREVDGASEPEEGRMVLPVQENGGQYDVGEY